MLQPALPNFTDPNLCHCLAASPEMEPSSQLASNPSCSPTPLLLHGPKQSPQHVLPAPIHTAQTQVTAHPSPDKNTYHELAGELLATAGRA